MLIGDSWYVYEAALLLTTAIQVKEMVEPVPHCPGRQPSKVWSSSLDYCDCKVDTVSNQLDISQSAVVVLESVVNPPVL
jgi:hypothetical protein